MHAREQDERRRRREEKETEAAAAAATAPKRQKTSAKGIEHSVAEKDRRMAGVHMGDGSSSSSAYIDRGEGTLAVQSSSDGRPSSSISSSSSPTEWTMETKLIEVLEVDEDVGSDIKGRGQKTETTLRKWSDSKELSDKERLLRRAIPAIVGYDSPLKDGEKEDLMRGCIAALEKAVQSLQVAADRLVSIHEEQSYPKRRRISSSSISSSTKSTVIPALLPSDLLFDLIIELFPGGVDEDPKDLFPSDSRIAEMSKFEPFSDRELSTEFVGREKFKKEVLEFTADHLKRFAQNREGPVQKQEFVFGNLLGGSGMGKTRASRETVNIINAHQDKIVDIAKEKGVSGVFLPQLENGEKLFSFSIDFTMENGDSVMPLEMNKGILEDEHRQGSVFGARIFSHFFFGSSVSALSEKLGEDRFELFYRAGVFRLNNVMQFVSKRLHRFVGKQQGGRPDATVILAVIADEYQIVREHYNVESTWIKSPWKQPLRGLASYAHESGEPNRKLCRDNVCLLPIIVGTLTELDVVFQPTYYLSMDFTLRPFEREQIFHLMEKKLDEDQLELLLYHQTSGDQLECLWYDVGMIPRSLQFSIQSALTLLPNKQAITIARMDSNWFKRVNCSIMDHLSSTLYRPSGTSGAMVSNSQLVDIVFSGFPLSAFVQDSEFMEPINGFRRLGYLYKTRQDKLYMAITFFRKMIAVDNTLGALREIFDRGYKLSGEDFERIDLYALVCRIRTLVLTCGRSDALVTKDLFPGSQLFGPQPGSVCLPKFTDRAHYFLHQEASFYMKKSKGMASATAVNDLTFDADGLWQLPRLAKDGQFGIDGRLILDTYPVSEKKVMIILQYKLYNGVPNTMPADWLESVAPALEKAYPDFNLVFVYITSAQIPDGEVKRLKYAAGDPREIVHNTRSQIEKQPASKRSVLLVHLDEDDKSLTEYFAPNLLPYLRAAVLKTNIDPRTTQSQQQDEEIEETNRDVLSQE